MTLTSLAYILVADVSHKYFKTSKGNFRKNSHDNFRIFDLSLYIGDDSVRVTNFIK